jgi:hypothetical protein
MFLVEILDFQKLVFSIAISQKSSLLENFISQQRNVLFYWNFQDILRVIRSIYGEKFRSKLSNLIFQQMPKNETKIQYIEHNSTSEAEPFRFFLASPRRPCGPIMSSNDGYHLEQTHGVSLLKWNMKNTMQVNS